MKSRKKKKERKCFGKENWKKKTNGRESIMYGRKKKTEKHLKRKRRDEKEKENEKEKGKDKNIE